MAHIEKHSKALLTRVRKIQGQANAIEKAISDGKDCIAVLQQISAIRGAVNGLMNQVMESHIREHLGDHTMSEAQRTQEVEEIVTILKSYLK